MQWVCGRIRIYPEGQYSVILENEERGGEDERRGEEKGGGEQRRREEMRTG